MVPPARKALLIGIETYDDGRFAPLPSCRADVWQLKQVLEHPAVGGFDTVVPLTDLAATDMRQAIGDFLDDAGPGDLALVYVSGHGVRLKRSDGEFFFAAKDTMFDQPTDTGVSASFVNEQLEACRSPHKIMIIDACESGGFAVGLRTRDAKASRAAPLQTRGVYVLSSSGPGEASYSGAPSPSGEAAPSVFTGEIIEALRTGKADSDGDGKVSVEDLFHHVSRRVRSQELQSSQAPVYSAVGVNSKIVVARVMAGAAIRLGPVPAAPAAGDGVPTAPAAATAPATREQQWARLLEYYQECLRLETADVPLLRAGDSGGRFIYLEGRERALSGGESDQDQLTLPGAAVKWVKEAAESEDELWAGYPAVLLNEYQGKQLRDGEFAPLLVRPVSVYQAAGELRVEPFGPAKPNHSLARALLGAEQAQHLVSTYIATWHGGMYAQMVRDIRNLLEAEFELPVVEELHPEYLSQTLDLRTPAAGARNVAVLFRVSRKEEAIANLLKDLDHIRQRPGQIAGTALAAVLPAPAPAPAPPSPAAATEASANWPLVTPLPCNEAQHTVIASAMTAALTVATGPPGSGKSQLVANLTATAVAQGCSVLVASTNNAAVNEVWRRCQRLVPGMLIRTGSRSGAVNYVENETKELTALLQSEPPTTNAATISAELTAATRRLADVRARLSGLARLERDLRVAAELREKLAGELSWTAADLASHFSGDAARWQRRAQRCADAKIFAGWRRRRLLRALDLPGELAAEGCRTVAQAAATEQRWALLRRQAAQTGPDAVLTTELGQAEQAVQQASHALADIAVRTAARSGQHLINRLLQAKQSGGQDWSSVKQVLRSVRGWAVTSLSVRRFPPEPGLFDLVVIDEASQCSIPQALPLLFRARRALIIGDPMQLPHIAEITPQREAAIRKAAGLSADWLESRRLAYRRHSAFDAMERAASRNHLLDEHYRCHPLIADVVNRMFYGGQLTVLTDTRKLKQIDRPPIVWVPVNGQPTRPPRGGSWVNQAEAVKVNECVSFLLGELPPDATVGVVTPFRAQANLIDGHWREEPRVGVGTAHTFQGGERDAIVLSLVASPQMSAGTIAWLESARNLWNVAISRARAHLIVIGDKPFWERRDGVGADLAAADALADEPPPSGDPLLQLLYERLSRLPGAQVELSATVNGYHADLLGHIDGTPTAVLLDRSATAGAGSPDRHLRLQLRRTELLSDPAGHRRAIRMPAWRLYDDEGQPPLPG